MTRVLTDAEHRQRVDAARARWAAAGLGAVAGGAAMFHVAHRGRAATQLAVALAHAANEGPERQSHAKRMAQLKINEQRWKTKLERTWPVPAMRAAYAQDVRDAQRHFRTAPTWFNSLFNEHDAPVDQEAWDAHRTKFVDAREGLEQLKDARAPVVTNVTGRTYTLSAHTRKAPVYDPKKTRAVKQAATRMRSAKRLAEAADADLAGGAPGPQHEAAFEDYAKAVEAHRQALSDARTAAKNVDPTATVQVRPQQGKAHRASGYKKTIPGTQTPRQLDEMRAVLRSKLLYHTLDREAAENKRFTAQIGRLRAALKPKLGFPAKLLLHTRGVPALAAAGAVAGGLAGYFSAKALQRKRLAKADEPDQTGMAETGVADHLDAAVSDAEGTVAENLATMFGRWKDAATNLIGTRDRALMTTVHTDLGDATAPLEAVMRRAIAAPVPGTVIDGTGQPLDVLLATDARAPQPQAYVEKYRKSRIAELTKDQRETIRDILLAATQKGTSPDEMARQIRDVIGLTRDQAQHVQNYRAELETLHPGALDRKLRDKRFDPTITRAIDNGEDLSAEQIDKMVAAYHRKYLAYRAMTIARTEGVGFANNGHVAAVRSFLEQHPTYTVIKTWNAKRDRHTRPDHYALHGTAVVGIDTPFTCESGDQIAYPHQPGAKARQVVNCRCYAEMRLVPRPLAARFGPKSVRPLKETVGHAPAPDQTPSNSPSGA